MNKKMVFHIIGRIIQVEACILLLPLAVSLIYKEKCWVSFAITAAVSLAVGTVMNFGSRVKSKVIYAKEGFVTVSLAWVLMSAVGALPFVISGEIPSYVDAFFETVSGFTTTGASILTDVESMSKGILFWRSFTHWIGGMGVLVFVMAIIPSITDRSIHIIRAEMPGPIVGKIVPKVKNTAKILYIIYIAMTVVEIILLCIGKMPLFESVVHSFGSAGTGGFGVKADSIAGYSPYLQWVITVFMFLFGVNFNLYYLILIRKISNVIKSQELWCYVGIAIAATAAIAVNTHSMFGSIGETIRASAFQVSSIMTTTGYATTDFALWPSFSKTILILLMCIGACAGSTGGGLKVSRVVLLFKMIKKELRHMLHPRSVNVVKFEEKTVSKTVLTNVSVYMVVYVAVLLSTFLLLSFEKFSLETNFSAAVACFNNIGPGLAEVGPNASYVAYSPFSKIVLSLAMLFGRLEIFPMLFLFSKSSWSKN